MRARQRRAGVDRAHWCESRERPSSRLCKCRVGGELRHLAVVDDAAVVHHAHEIADFLRDAEILLDQQDRRAAALDLLQAIDQAADDRRRKALGRLVDQQQPARLDDRARDRHHLLLPARQRARAREPEFPQRGKEAENPLQPRLVERPFARAEHEVFLDAEVGEDRHRLGHIGDARARDRARGQARRSARRRA